MGLKSIVLIWTTIAILNVKDHKNWISSPIYKLYQNVLHELLSYSLFFVSTVEIEGI